MKEGRHSLRSPLPSRGTWHTLPYTGGRLHPSAHLFMEEGQPEKPELAMLGASPDSGVAAAEAGKAPWAALALAAAAEEAPPL